MNRHLRNFLFFALAFTLTLLAGFASAANIKLSGPNSIGQSGSSYLRGDGNPTTTFTKSSTPAPSEVLSDSKVLMKRVFDVAGETANGPWSGVIIDAMEVPKATLATRLKDAVKLGLKPGGLLGSLALGIAADWMINKGFQWMESGQNWLSPSDPTYPGYYYFSAGPSTFPSCGDTSHAMAIDALKTCFANKMAASGYTVKGTTVVYVAPNYYVQCNPCTMNGTDSWPKYAFYRSGTNTAPGPVATSAQLDATMDDLATQKLKDVADAFMNDASTLPIPDDAKTTPTGGPYTTPIRDLGTTTTNNPDGSRKVENKQGQDSVKPDGGATPAAPINFKTENITTTTTNNYNIDNTVTTTTSVSTKSGSGTDDTKTDCDKKPDSIGCSDWGDAPSSPDLPSQDMSPSFSWSPFAISSYCPQPKSIVTHFGTYQLEYTPMCNLATGIKPLVLAFAFLGALFICFGARNDG